MAPARVLDQAVFGQHPKVERARRGRLPYRLGRLGRGQRLTAAKCLKQAAATLATELSLPLFTIRLDALISKYMGETSTKLRTIFDGTAETRAVYLFDEFDALGAQRTSGNDVGEARRILNTFLLFLDDTQPESLVVAATNHPALLDRALWRRFDAVVTYDLPTPSEARDVLLRRLGTMGTSAVDWGQVEHHVDELSHAELVRAAESAAKQAILQDRAALDTAGLTEALDERREARHG